MKLFVDVETTGLKFSVDDITQVTMLLTDDNYQPISWYNEFFYSDLMTSEVLNIQGLTFEEYESTHKKKFTDEVESILLYLSQTDYTLYAYNQSFDVRMLKANLERAGRPTPQIKGIELMKRRQKLTQNMIERGYNLDAILTYTVSVFGDARGPHDARFDVICNLLLARDERL